MSARQIPSARKLYFAPWSTAAAGLLLVVLSFVSHGGETSLAETRSTSSLFPRTEPAKNPAWLRLTVDPWKVLGWIAGTEDRTGEEVLVEYDGRAESIVVQPGNTFTWRYALEAKTEVEFRVGEFRESATLGPRPPAPPTVFFVVDRPVYRPGQKLQFAAFLRQLEETGPADRREFRPLAKRTVDVEVRSLKKKTLAARLSLVSDASGRITGEYRFVDADPLDDYRLEAKGYTGSATVTLAEFRKSKVKLEITGELAGAGDISGERVGTPRLRVTFSAVDFLEQPVSNSRVHFTASVVSKSEPECDGPCLDARDFAYASRDIWLMDRLEHLDENEVLLFESGAAIEPDALYRGPSVFASFEADLTLDSGTAETRLDLEKDWIERGYVVEIHGVLVDENGREERAFASVPLEDDRPERLRLTLPKRSFGTGEPIPIVVQLENEKAWPAEVMATLVVMKLSPRWPPRGYGYYGYFGYNGYNAVWGASGWQAAYAWSPGVPAAALHHRYGAAARWRPVTPPDSAESEVTTALPLENGRGMLIVDEPGAYRVKVIARSPDGAQLEEEASCVILSPEALPGLVLQLDGERYFPGDRVTGEVHSRFADARLLLTVSDASGTRLWRTVRLNGARSKLDFTLPERLDYGAVVGVEYVAANGVVHFDARPIRVLPQDRMLDIRTRLPEVVEPGETVDIELEVNRREEVDLVVSVYDQSLLGIAPDRSVDIRDFYLADDRPREEMAATLLERKLLGVTVEALLERAQHLLEEEPSLEGTKDGLLTRLVSQSKSGYLYSIDIRTLLWLAGVRSELISRGSWYVRLDPERKSHPLLDLLSHTHDDWRLSRGLSGNVVVLVERHSSQDSRAGGWPFEAGLHFNARGDAHYSAGGNGAFSYLPSGQAFISYLAPVGHSGARDADAAVVATDGMIRRDFSDSAFFSALVRTDNEGRASVGFRLPDSLTNWRVVVTAISRDTHVGHHTASFRTFKPVMVWPMLPRTFTRGDRVELYASVHNRTEVEQLMTVSIDVEGGEVHGPRVKKVLVSPGCHRPVYWTFEPRTAGFCEILMSARCDAGSDASLKRLPVNRCAIEEVVTASGFAEGEARIRIPEDVNLHDSILEISLAPSLAADMLDSLDYLVEYPHGCVEQTMSRFLPTLEVAKILSLYGISRPELEARLPGYVAAGIKRLVELQKPDGGWGWIGSSQTHEMMTPYALYGLVQAESAGYEIGSPDVIKRGFDRLEGFINGLGDANAADRVYCMYVYSLQRSLREEWWRWLGAMLDEDKLSDYAAALALEIAVREPDREAFADRLAGVLTSRAKTGSGRVYWTTAKFSRWGEDPGEITAAVMKALVRYDSRHESIPGILSYFASTKRGNRWKSTKDTAMILFAMCDYLARVAYNPLGEKVSLLAVNGGAARRVVFDDGLSKELRIPGHELHHGDNHVRFLNDVPGVMYRIVFRYWKEGREIEPRDHGLVVARRFWLLGEDGRRVKELEPGDRVPRGAYLASDVSARHGLHQAMRYVLVTNPKPAGCEVLPGDDPRFRQSATSFVLREDETRAVLWHHETIGVWLRDGCVLHAELAGDYTVPPASVELMYEPDTRGHSGTFHFKVVDQGSRR